MQVFESFAESFEGKVLGIALVVHHFQEHEEDGVFVTAQEPGKCILIAVERCPYQLIIMPCLFRKMSALFYHYLFLIL